MPGVDLMPGASSFSVHIFYIFPEKSPVCILPHSFLLCKNLSEAV